MTELFRSVSDEKHGLYVQYLCVTDCRKDSICLQDGETIGWRWADRRTVLSTPDVMPERVLRYLRQSAETDGGTLPP